MQVTLSGSCFISSHIYIHKFFLQNLWKVRVIKQKWKKLQKKIVQCMRFFGRKIQFLWNWNVRSSCLLRGIRHYLIQSTEKLNDFQFSKHRSCLHLKITLSRTVIEKPKGMLFHRERGLTANTRRRKKIWCASLNTSLIQHFTPHNSAL